MEEHAQKEIREYALAIYKIVNKICPISIKHFMEYKFNSLTLGESELKILSEVLHNNVEYIALDSEEEMAVVSKIHGMVNKAEWRNEIIKIEEDN
jgi:thymidylate synthase ThyX